ncbi:MAG: CBS domain-containing protein [Candidatus Helarchaeota archaeon]
MIYLTLSYFDTVLGPRTFCTIPESSNKELEDYTNSLLNISEFIDLKFFVYISSPHFKTSNIYTKIPSEWARGGLEMVLLSIVLVDEEFNRLFVFEEILENLVGALGKIDRAYIAFYDENQISPKQLEDLELITKKRAEIKRLLESYLPEIHELIETARRIPTESDVIEIEENLQDEYIQLNRSESVLEAAKKLAASPRILIGCVIEDDKVIGVVDEDDILNKVILKGKDPLSIKVEDIMTREVIQIDSNAPTEMAINLIIEKGIQAIPILHDGRFFGVFTIFDALNHNQRILEILTDNITEIAQQKMTEFKKLKIKLWSYIRNVTQHRKARAFAKKLNA